MSLRRLLQRTCAAFGADGTAGWCSPGHRLPHAAAAPLASGAHRQSDNGGRGHEFHVAKTPAPRSHMVLLDFKLC
jgi:hypothetical protein